jgi:beta-glucosidase
MELAPSEKRTVEFTIGIDDLKFYGKQNKWIVEEGKFSITISNLSKDFNFKR